MFLSSLIVRLVNIFTNLDNTKLFQKRVNAKKIVMFRIVIIANIVISTKIKI